MTDQPIRLALVGCDLVDPSRLQGAAVTVAVASAPLTPEVMRGLVGAAAVATTFEEALDSHGASFDAVLFIDSKRDTLPMIRLAAEAGKHVCAAAPATASLKEMEAAVRACASAGVSFSIGNTLRSLPSNQKIKAQIEENKLGVPGLLRGHHWCYSDFEHRENLLNHIYGDIDLAAWFFEALPSEVYALSQGEDSELAAGEKMFDYLQVHLGFPGGGMAMFDFATILPDGQDYRSLYLIGSTGAAYADDHHNSHLMYRGGFPRAFISREKHKNVVYEVQDFVDAIRGQQQPAVTGKDACNVHKIVEAIKDSCESGQVMIEKEGTYEPR
jgi:predicted dehydrogenase